MGFLAGFEAILYYKVGGVAGGGSWLPINIVRDATTPMSADEIDVTTRGIAAGGFKAQEPLLKSGEVNFDIIWDPTDAAFTALMNAFLGRLVIGIATRDQLGASGQGIEADMKVFNLEKGEPLNDAQTASVTVKTCFSATLAAWTTGVLA